MAFTDILVQNCNRTKCLYIKKNNFLLLEPMIFCSLNDFATYYDELLFKS